MSTESQWWGKWRDAMSGHPFATWQRMTLQQKQFAVRSALNTTAWRNWPYSYDREGSAWNRYHARVAAEGDTMAVRHIVALIDYDIAQRMALLAKPQHGPVANPTHAAGQVAGTTDLAPIAWIAGLLAAGIVVAKISSSASASGR